MQLDRTEIVIRQRSALELLDLSLLVLKRHWRPIFLSSMLIGLPLLLLDIVAVAWMFSEDTLMAVENTDSPLIALRWRHAAHVMVLYFLQFPLASLPTTVLLGNLVFYEHLPLRALARRMLPIATRSILVLGIMRLGLVGLILELFVSHSVIFDWRSEFVLLVVFASIAVLMRACWPFAPEILGLELCPLTKGKSKEKVTYAQRSRRLHQLLMADHVARFVTAGFFGALLLVMLLGLQLWVAGISMGRWQWEAWCDYLALPLSLWILGQFFAVFRFLSYLDSRIRLEGWEIELRLRAEAIRLVQPQRVSSGSTSPLTEQVA